jgi:hypothetical protein
MNIKEIEVIPTDNNFFDLIIKMDNITFKLVMYEEDLKKLIFNLDVALLDKTVTNIKFKK